MSLKVNRATNFENILLSWLLEKLIKLFLFLLIQYVIEKTWLFGFLEKNKSSKTRISFSKVKWLVVNRHFPPQSFNSPRPVPRPPRPHPRSVPASNKTINAANFRWCQMNAQLFKPIFFAPIGSGFGLETGWPDLSLRKNRPKCSPSHFWPKFT
jgi:hypothetical protein